VRCIYEACCYRRSMFRSLSVSVGHNSEPGKGTNWLRCHLGEGGQTVCVVWGCSLAPPGEYSWMIPVWQWCGRMSDYTCYTCLLNDCQHWDAIWERKGKTCMDPTNHVWFRGAHPHHLVRMIPLWHRCGLMSVSLSYVFYGVSLASVSYRRHWPPPTTPALTTLLG